MKDKMKIAIVGSREFKDEVYVKAKVQGIFLAWRPNNPILVSGGAKGVDTWAEEEVKVYDFPTIIYLPEWEKYGKSAGFRRNELIINSADLVIAFWDGKSKGTKHSIDLAIKSGKPLDIYVRR